MAAAARAQNPPGFRELNIGDPAPAFKLVGVDDTSLTLEDFKESKFLAKYHAGLPDHLKKSLAREGRATNNCLYQESGMDALIKALDPEWTGPEPHTILVAPGGRIVFRHTGVIGEAELLEKVIAEMTPYYQP
jgi:peroxiredoxin